MKKRLFNSVRFRTTLAATVAVAVALTVSAFGVVLIQRHTLTNGIQTTAREQAESIALSIGRGDANITLPVQSNEDSITQVVDASSGAVVAGSVAAPDEPVSKMRPAPGVFAHQSVEHFGTEGQSDFLIVAYGAAGPNGNYVILIGDSLESVTNATVVLIALFGIAVPALIVFVGIVTWTVSGKALRPVQEIRTQVERIESTDLSQRVPEPEAQDEIGQLARTMNLMLARLEASTDKQRRFVADASHELRSPLAGIQARLEVDLAYPDGADWRTTGKDVLDETHRLARLVEDLLTLARLDENSRALPAFIAVDLDEVVLAETAQLKALSINTVDTSRVSGAQVRGNRDALRRVVRNLLDNADRHATSTVSIALEENDSEIVLTITDDGPGIPLDKQAAIFERFTRLDEGRTRDAGGTGLGLAIVREIATAHGAVVTVANTPGAAFTITFPVPTALAPAVI